MGLHALAAALTPPIRAAPLRVHLSPWRHFRLTPVLCRLHCPRVYSMRRPAATNRQRGAGKPEKLRAETLYPLLLARLVSERGFLGTMNCSGRCHCPIARGPCRVLHGKLYALDLSLPPFTTPTKSSSSASHSTLVRLLTLCFEFALHRGSISN